MLAPTPPIDVALIHHPESPCSAAIKTQEVLCWSKLLRCSAPGLCAMPGLSWQWKLSNLMPTPQPKWAELTSQVRVNTTGSIRKISGFLTLLTELLDDHWWRRIWGKHWGEGLSHRNEGGYLIAPAKFQKKRASLVNCMGHHRMVYTLHSDRSRAGEARHLQVRCWTIRNYDAWNVALDNSWQLRTGSQQEMGHCTAHFATSCEMPSPRQGHNKHPKALTQGREVRHQQVSWHLTCRQPCSLLDWACQIRSWKLFMLVLGSAVCARQQKCKRCRYPSSVSA